MGYQVTAGSVTPSPLAATWSVADVSPGSWHVLTKTLRVLENPGYADTISETLSVTGATYQPPARVILFQHRRPQPTWQKTVQINDGSPRDWKIGGFVVAPGDTVTVTDRVSVDHTADVTFTLVQQWGDALDLVESAGSTGAVTPGTDTLSWEGTEEEARQWHTLTTAFHVVGAVGLRDTLTETLTVEDADAQLPQRLIDLLVSHLSEDCYARVNDHAVTYSTVQAAVDAAQAGDLVKVAGHCSDINLHGGLVQVVSLDKSLTIQGGYTTTNWSVPDSSANPTTLDAAGHGRVLVIQGAIAPTIEGLRITGGNAEGMGGGAWWGQDSGGGVYVSDASPVISGNVIYDNGSSYYGGGVFLHNSGATLTANTITGNTALPWGWGGGLFIRNSGDATLARNTISGNTAGNGGGGLSLNDSNATLRDNMIRGNSASTGAGLELVWSDADLVGNIVAGNTALSLGGGLSLLGGAPTLVNTVVADNSLTSQEAGLGSGIHVRYSSPRLMHTTIARNFGGDSSGVYVARYGAPTLPSTVAMTNTIVAGQAVGITVTMGSTATLNATLWHANDADWGGEGTINHTNDHAGNPAFAGDGYHLTGSSAAIDRGVDAKVRADIDGDDRPQGAGYDLGADEFLSRIYLPLVMRND